MDSKIKQKFKTRHVYSSKAHYHAILERRPSGYLRTKYLRISSNLPKHMSERWRPVKVGITHKNNAIPKVIGMKIYSTGTRRVWKTLWLHKAVSVRGGSRNSATYNHGTAEKKMPRMSAQMAAGIVYKFRRGLCWKIPNLRPRVAKRLLATYRECIGQQRREAGSPPLHKDQSEKVDALGPVQNVLGEIRRGAIAECE